MLAPWSGNRLSAKLPANKKDTLFNCQSIRLSLNPVTTPDIGVAHPEGKQADNLPLYLV